MGSSRKGIAPIQGNAGMSSIDILGDASKAGSLAKGTKMRELRDSTQNIGDVGRQYALGKTLGSMIYQNPENAGLQRKTAQQSFVAPAMDAAKTGAGVAGALETDLYNRALGDIQDQMGLQAAQQKSTAGKIGAGAQGAASLLALFSDETLKRDVMAITDFTKQTLGYLTPYMFKYNESVGIHGQMVGIMAQDLEKSSLGKTIIEDVDGKKAIDMQKAMSFILASLADINQRLEKAGV